MLTLEEQEGWYFGVQFIRAVGLCFLEEVDAAFLEELCKSCSTRLRLASTNG
jgi:hypothetical protein